MVERLRRMQEVVGSNLTFFQEFIRFVYLLVLYEIMKFYIKINLFVKLILEKVADF